MKKEYSPKDHIKLFFLMALLFVCYLKNAMAGPSNMLTILMLAASATFFLFIVSKKSFFIKAINEDMFRNKLNHNTLKIKLSNMSIPKLRSVTYLSLLLSFISISAFAQPGSMSNNTDCDGSYGNNTMTLVGVGNNNATFTYREQANANTASGTKFYQFNADGYFNVWNLNTPTYNAVSTAVWGTGGYNAGIRMGATTINSYYTFNLRRGTSYASQSMSILQTAYNPTNINSYTTPTAFAGQTPTMTVTLAAALQTNEFVYVAYSTDAFATSGNSGVLAVTSSAANVYTFTMPAYLNGTVVTFYPFTSTSSSAPSYSDAPILTLNMRSSTGQNNTGAYSTYTVQAWVTAANGNWSTAATWTANAVPPTINSMGAVTIAHNITQDQNATVSSITINAARTLTASANTLTISNNASATTFANSGTLTASGTHTVTFAGSGTHTISGTQTFQNVTTTTGVNFGANSTISATGAFQINGGGFVSTNAPTYAAGSTLFYNVATYGASAEWATGVATGQGVPSNVTIGNGISTFLNFGASAAYRRATGNVTIPSLSGLTLSTAGGGDLQVGGNFTNNGSLTNNGRWVIFNGSSAQTLTGNTTFDNLRLNNSTGLTLQPSSAITINTQFDLTSGRLTIVDNNVTLASVATFVNQGASNYILTNGNGRLFQVVAGVAKIFPVGNSVYNPITFTNTGTSDTYGIRVVDGAPANANDATRTVLRSWYISEGLAGGSNLTPVVAQYNAGDVGANYVAATTPYMGFYNGTGWSQVPTTLGGAITATSTGSGQFPATIPVNSYIAIGKDLGLSNPPPTVTSVDVSSGYSGSTIVITGTNFTGVSAVSFGGTAAASYVVNSLTQITAVVGTGGASGNVVVTNGGGNGTLAGFTYLGFITTSGATDWNTAASWLGGIVPTANTAVTIAHNLTIPVAITNSPVTSVTVNSGITANVTATVAALNVTNTITTVGTGTFTFSGAGGSATVGGITNAGTLSWTAAATLNISAGGTLTNNGTFTRGTGTVNIVNGATINGSNAITFNNLNNTTGTLTLTTVPTIDGILTLNGGSVSAAPIYTSNSTLFYNVGYNRFNEWNATGIGTIGITPGYPNNVTINTGAFDVVNGSNTARAIAGLLTINSGGTFNVNALNAILTIGNGVTINGGGTFNQGTSNGAVNITGAVNIAGGALTMGSSTGLLSVTGSITNTSGALALSSALGGDLRISGNFTNNGTLTHNTRAVFLNGTSQTIAGSNLNTSGTNNCFDYLFIQNGTNATLGANIAIRTNLTFTLGTITLGSNNLNLGTASITTPTSTSYVVTNGSGQLFRTVAASAITFPVGNSTYNPITFTNTGTSDTYGIRVTDGAPVNANAPLVTVNRSWYITEASPGNSNLTPVVAQYNAGDVGANYNAGTTPYLGLYDGSSWNQVSTTLGGSITATSTGSGQFPATIPNGSYFAIGKDLGLSNPPPTVSSFLPTSGYSGSTIVITGNNLLGTTAVSFGGTAAASFVVDNINQITAVVGTGGASGNVSVTNAGGTAPLGGFTYLGFITSNLGDWNTPASWLGGVLPTANSTVTINLSLDINANVTNNISSLTITPLGSLFWSVNATLNISAGGTITNNGNFNPGIGTVNFVGAGTVAGSNAIIFNNVNVGGGLTLTTQPRVDGTLQINSGGFLASNLIYTANSTLRYNTTGTYGRGAEWNATGAGTINSTAGYPNNVQISNNTTLNLGNAATGTARACNGNLTVDDGSTLSMNVGGSVMTAALTVRGNVTLGSAATANLILSGSIGGDLIVNGNWTRNATSNLINNGRQVTFGGTAPQTLTGNTTFDFFRLNNSNGLTLHASSPITINNQCDLSNGTITIGANNVTLASGATFINQGANNYILTNSTGQLRQVVAGTARIFPVGNSTYNPITFTNTGTSDTYGIRVTDGAPANANAPLVTVNRSWFVTEATPGNSNLTPVVAQYNAGDVGANYNAGTTPYLGLYDGTAWNQVPTTLGGAITATSTGSGQFPATIPSGSYFAIGKDLGLSNPPPTVSSFLPTSGYSGSTIVITGNNFIGTTAVSFGGTAAASFVVDNINQITAVVGTGGASGNVSVTNAGGTASLGGFTYLGFITTTGATDWNTPASWLGGVLPIANSTVTIDHDLEIATNVANNISSVTINSFKQLYWPLASLATLNISAGGTITNNGIFNTLITGTVNFVGAGTVAGSNIVNFNNVNINGGLTLTTQPRVDGTLQINSGGFLASNLIYTANSTLRYNTTGTYGRGAEWNATGAGTINSTAGYPNNVQISNNTTLNLGNAATGTARACNGNLTVDDGSTLSMNVGGSVMTAALTVRGNVTLGSAATANLILSGSIGGDLIVNGNWTRNATSNLINNGRQVTFGGTAPQTLTGNTTFDFFRLNNSNGLTLHASSPITINNQCDLSNGTITIGANNVTLASGATFINQGANNYILTNSTGQLRQVVAGTARIFPVGNSTYNPITFTNTGTSDTYGIRVTDGAPVNANAPLVTVNRSWYITENVPGNSNLTPVVAQYNAGDVGANYNAGTTPYLGLYDGTAWNQVPTTLGGAITATSTGSGQFPATIPSGAYFAIGKDLGLSNPAAEITSLNVTSGYSGSTIVITGDYFLTATAVSFGGTPAASFVINNINQITAVVGTGGASGNVTVTNVGGTGTLGGFTYLGFITTSGATNWNTPASWLGGVLPTANTAVTIDNDLNIAANVANNVSSLTINSGRTLAWTAAATLNISAAGTITNNGTFSSGTGTVNFNGAGTINPGAGIAFNNIYIAGGVNLGQTTVSINDSLRINAGGFVSTPVGPNYGANAWLVYNTGGPYGRNNEWNATFSSGFPSNVRVRGGTSLDISNGSNTARAISGSIIIGQGSSATMSAMTNNLTVPGDFTLNGTFSQSTAVGGDLDLRGDWNSGAAAVLNSNNRQTIFNGNGPQSIVTNNLLTFGYLIIDNTAAGVTLSNPIIVNTFQVNAGRIFNLNASKITITAYDGSNPARLINNGTINANAGTIEYASLGQFTNNAAFNSGIGTLDFTNGTVSITTGVQTSFYNIRCFTNGGIDFGTGGIRGRVFGTLELRAGSYIANNAPIYEAGSLLLYNGGGTFDRNVEWDVTTLKSVEIANNTTVVAGTNGATFVHEMANDLTIGVGSTFRMTGPDMTALLRVRGNITNQGSLILSGAPFGDLEVGGDFTNTGTFTTNNRSVTFIGTSVTPQTISGAPPLFTAIMNNSGGGLDLLQALTVTNNLNFTNGDINLGNNNLTYSGTQANLVGGAFNSYVNTNGTGRMLQVVGAIPVRYPVGRSAYNPVVLTNIGTSDTYGVILNDGPVGSEVLATKAVQRNWDINEAIAGGSNLTVNTQWNAPIAQAGEEGSLFIRNAAEKWMGRFSGGLWTKTAATLSGTNPYNYQASGFTSLGIFEPGIENAFLPSDAGISAITLPSPLCEGSTGAVSVTVNNYGIDVLNTVTVTLTINGVAQTPVTLGTGTPLGIAAAGSATLSIGSYTFPSGISPIAIEATTSLPNGGADANSLNNTFTIGSQVIIQNVGTPSFIAGAASLCNGATSTYTATAANSTLIEYSIFSGGATINISTGVVSSVTSSFVVRATAYNACGTGVSNDFSVTVSPLLLAPTFTTFNYNTATSVDISWVASPTATSYILEYGTSITFASTIFSGNIGNVLSYPVTGLVSGNIYYYRVRAVNPTCGNSPWSDVTPFLTTAIVWEGTVSTDWNVPQNWSPFLVPNGSLDAEIFDRVNDPVIPTAGLNANVRNITFQSGSIQIQSTKSLNVNGNWTSNGNIISGSGQVVFNGTGAQTITGATTFENLTFNKTSGTLAITSGIQSIRGIVRPTNGTLTTGDNLRLVSNASTTGIISGIGAGTISGNVEVNRFMPGPTGYRYVSSPITQATGLTTADFDVALVGANGLVWDPLFSIPSPFPNCWYYDETQQNTYAQYGWTSATPGSLVTGRGYALITPANHTASLVGPVNNGAVAATNPITRTGVLNGAGVNLIGNPYPSPISWNAFRALNGTSEIAAVVKRFASTGSYYGQYVDWNGSVGTPGSVGDNIALGQAFFITKTNAGSLPINYTNAIRVDNSSTTFYETQPEVNNLLRMQLVGGAGADELVVYFDPTATNNYDVNYDAIKFLSETAGIPNIYTNIDTLKVSINVLEVFNQDMVIPMGIVAKTAGNYQVNVVDMSTFAPSATVYLEDRNLGTFTNLRAVNQYNVNLPVGEHNGRFFIHFHPAVEVAVTNETCQQTDGTVTVTNPSTEQQWNVSLLDIAGQVVAQSTDANTAFTNLNDGGYTLKIVDASGYTVEQPISIEAGQVVEANIAPMNSNFFYTTDLIEASVAQVVTGMTYEWYLNGQLAGTGTEIALNVTEPGMYELMLKMSGATCIFQTSTSFSVTQETTVGIATEESASGFIIYPNPTRDMLNVQINQKIGFNKLSIFDASGRLVHTEILNGAQGQQTIQVNLNNLAAGLYQITLEGNQKRSTAKFSKTK